MVAAHYHSDKDFSNLRIYPPDKAPYLRSMAAAQTSAQIRLANLRALIDEAGGSAIAARRLEMTDSQLSQIGGRKPTRNIGTTLARRIELAWGKPIGWLDVAHETYAIRQSQQTYNVADGPALRTSVPLISWVQAGEWADTIDNLQPRDADQWIPTHARVGKHAYALRVVGDSMVSAGGPASFPEGIIIIVDPDREAKPGHFVVVRQNHDTECTFKQLVKDAGRLFLKPLNPQYPTMEMRQDAVICGVLVQAVMEF